MYRVTVTYDLSRMADLDDICVAAVGRHSDFSGCGFGLRDLGWDCPDEMSAHRIRKALGDIGLKAAVIEMPEPGDA